MNYKGFLLDMDGVLYRGDEKIQSAIDAVNKWKSQGKTVFFMTNNATRLPSEYVKKLESIGIAADETEIITAGVVAAEYMKQYPGKKVLCCSSDAVKALIKNHGLIVAADNDTMVDFVIASDCEFDRERLYYATNAIHRGAKFIGTNPDTADPDENNRIRPVTGSILAYLEAATGMKPKILGKPNPEMYTLALERMQLSKKEVLVIGDRLDTDIKGALDLGIDAALVLTGVHQRPDIKSIVPKIIIDCLN